jgi:hypothetical protein
VQLLCRNPRKREWHSVVGRPPIGKVTTDSTTTSVTLGYSGRQGVSARTGLRSQTLYPTEPWARSRKVGYLAARPRRRKAVRGCCP